MSVDQLQAETWMRAVEAALLYLSDDYIFEPDDLLTQEAFIARLDGTVGLDPDADAETFADLVEQAVAAHVGESYQPEHAEAGTPNGGQFVSPGGGSKKSAPKRRRPGGSAAKKPGVLGMGTGIGTPGGNPATRELQDALNALGFKDADGKALAKDGEFGPRTTAATKAMQKSLGLPQDGKVTPELLARVKQLAAAKAPGRAKEAVVVVGEQGPELVFPDRGDYISDERTTEATDHIEGHVTESLGTDAAGGRVFRVRIIREGTSRNRKRYTEAVLRRAAPLYNGAKCYDHHRTPAEMATSTLQGLVGGYRNVAYEGDGLYGDLHLFPSAVQTAEALSAAIDAQAAGLPPLVGISHDVLASFKAGTPTNGGHVQEAVAITRVHSADVVADPSAGGQATRVLAGGVDQIEEEAAVPLTAAEISAIAAAVRELGQPQPVTEAVAEPERVTESGTPKTDFAAQVIIREKLAEAGMSAMRESITARLPERITEADIDAEISAYKAILADMERANLAPTVTTQVVKESRDKKVAALDAFFAQNWTEGYHSFRQAFLDITGYQPRSWGEDVNRLVLRESFGGGFDSGIRATESMDSTTWAQVLGDSVTRRVVAAYNTPTLSTWRRIVSSTAPISDFRTQRVGRTGGYGVLPTVAEGGPYQPLTSPGDEEATGALSKKGGTEDVTLEMIANDDRRAISQIPSKLGRAAAQTLYRDVFDTLVDNDTCTYDSVALFHSSHANTDTSAGLAQSTLTTGRRKMIEQAAYGDSSEILALTPKFLIVPPELEETGFVLAGSRAVPASNTVGASDQPNIHAGIEPILVPYLTDANDWFLVADPQAVPTLEVGFYNGRQEPELFTQSDNSVGSVFNSDTFTWKIRFIYLVMILDHRGFYRGQG